MSRIILSVLAVLLSVVYGALTEKKGPCDDTRECIRYNFENDDRMLCFGYYGVEKKVIVPSTTNTTEIRSDDKQIPKLDIEVCSDSVPEQEQ